jgi:hypothetical protein
MVYYGCLYKSQVFIIIIIIIIIISRLRPTNLLWCCTVFHTSDIIYKVFKINVITLQF